MTTNATHWQQQLWTELRRDKKKTTILAVLLVVAIVVVLRTALNSPSPREAQAAQAGGLAVIESGAGAIPQAPAVARPGEKPRKDPLWKSPDVRRDVFAASLEYYPPEQAPAPEPPPVAAVTAPAPAVDLEAEANAVRASARRQLALQSTVSGADPFAIINGLVVRMGDSIAGFQVKEITSRTCVIEKGGVQVVLEMKN